MKNQKTTALAILASLFPGVCLGQVPQAVMPTKLKAVLPHAKHFLKKKAASPVTRLQQGNLAGLRPMSREFSQALGDSFSFSRAGDQAILLGNWAEAKENYQNALGIIPANPQALYGMARCAEEAGNTSDALKYYRLEVYSHDASRYGVVPGDGFQDNDIKRLMQFALLLNKVGQVAEGVFIYNRAASLVDYQNGDVQSNQQKVRVLLPELVAENPQMNQVLYTPEHLQAFADTALAREETSFSSDKEAKFRMQEAVKLYPDSPVIQYYLGEALMDSYYHTVEHPTADKVAMTAAYKKAIELGDNQTIGAAKERLSQCP